VGGTVEHSAGRWCNLNGPVVERAAVHAEGFCRLFMVSSVIREKLCIAEA
jgi:hypothetical protein